MGVMEMPRSRALRVVRCSTATGLVGTYGSAGYIPGIHSNTGEAARYNLLEMGIRVVYGTAVCLVPRYSSTTTGMRGCFIFTNPPEDL